MHLDTTPTPPRRPHDLRVLGARALPTRALVRQLVGARADDDDIDDAVAALMLGSTARDAALLASPLGPRLLAAVELGRRTWLTPSPARARITGPGDVVAAVGPRLVSDVRVWSVALDVRLRIARVTPLQADGDDGDDGDVGAVAALQACLGAGCRRLVLVRREEGPAVPGDGDVTLWRHLIERASVVGVVAVDSVIVGDDGWCSLLRLGLGGGRERRYR